MDNNVEIQVDGHLATIPFFQKAKTVTDLVESIALLKTLCIEVNPYGKVTEEQFQHLKNFEIHDIFDPFTVTNKLLILLDETEQLLKNYQND